MSKNRFISYLKKNAADIVCFIVGFVIMAIALKDKNMVAGSGDALNTWSYITKTGDYSWPYTLYKGLVAVQPYTLFYKISLFLGVGEFFFIKIYHCILFAYAAGIGFPKIASVFLKKEANIFLRILLVLLLFKMFCPTMALDQMMVDLPTLAYFVGLVHCAFMIFEKKQYNVWRFVILGLLTSINLMSSGQYTIPSIFIMIYVFSRVLPILIEKFKNHNIIGKFAKKALIVFFAFLIGVIPLKAADYSFKKNVVSKLNIPSVEFWMNRAYITRFYTQTFQNLPDYRGEAILKDYYGDAYNEELEQSIKNGEQSITFMQYLKISLKYPLDSVSRWCNRFFLCFKVDGSTDLNSQNAMSLFLSYTLLFVSLLAIKKRCKSFKDIFNPKFWVVIGFIMAVMACCVTCVEQRTCLQLQGLVYTVGLLDDTIWSGFKNCFLCIKEAVKSKSIKPISCRPVPYGFFMYCIFILMCLIHCASIYEMSYVDNATILFDYKF